MYYADGIRDGPDIKLAGYPVLTLISCHILYTLSNILPDTVFNIRSDTELVSDRQKKADTESLSN